MISGLTRDKLKCNLIIMQEGIWFKFYLEYVSWAISHSICQSYHNLNFHPHYCIHFLRWGRQNFVQG